MSETDTIELLRPEEVTKRPTVSLHLLVKNGESVVGRLIDNVRPYIDEVVAVVNDTTDGTIGKLIAYTTLDGLPCKVIKVTAASHPHLYIQDVAETYQIGRSLIGEDYQGPFTERPLLADWATVRNLGWSVCSKEWRLFLDADDLVSDPHAIPGLCQMLSERGFDAATSQYRYRHTLTGEMKGAGYRERLVKNVPYITWHGKTHEILRGQSRPVHIEGTLLVDDMKDSAGAGLRVPGRCFKILYHQARSCDWQVSPRDLLYMAMEIRAEMPTLASKILEVYLEKSVWPEERAWACCMRGEIDEVEDKIFEARGWYAKALVEHPGTKSAFRLCRANFKAGMWKEAVEAYRMGMKNRITVQLIDDGEVYEDASKILVAVSLRKLGRFNEALDFCREARAAFPANTTLIALQTDLEKAAGRNSGSVP